MNKLQMEKNKFIRELSREQFDLVITNKYKKVFVDYFNGDISDSELADKIDSNLDLIGVYENGDSGKIDSNQYLYSAIVDVALNYYNVANGLDSCINKVNLLSSYFQLCALADSKFEYLLSLIDDVFFINGKLDGSDADSFLKNKLAKILIVFECLDSLLTEIAIHESVISDVEKETKSDFVDDVHIDDTIKEMYVKFHDSANEVNTRLFELKNECVDDSTGAKLDIVKGKLA